MKKLFLLFVCAMLLPSCAEKRVDPNYQAMLAEYRTAVQQQLAQNREIVTLEAGDNPITLPPGAKLTINAPPPEIQYPAMYRDYRQEAAYQLIGNGVNALLGHGLSGLFNYLNNRENRKIEVERWQGRQGISFNATKDINFSGGIGDYGQRGYSPTITPAPVVTNPTIVPPVVNNPTIINPPVIIPPVIIPEKEAAP